jgi:hypothetical protein
MEILHLITPLEGNLKAALQLRPVPQQADSWILQVDLFYDGSPAGSTSFRLNGYSRADAEQVARTVRSNAYMMKEIDEFLWGESD